MLHIDANNPDQLWNWIHYNLQNDCDASWHLKTVEEIISSKKANTHDRAYLEEQILLSRGYRASRLFVIECDLNSMKYGSCYTICFYKSRGNHNGPKGNDLFWFDSTYGIRGPYMSLDDIKKYIYDLWRDKGSVYSHLKFSSSINSKPGMNLDEYIRSINIDKPYDPRFISGQYIYGPTQKELPNDFPTYGLVDYHALIEKLTNNELKDAFLKYKTELLHYKYELSLYIKSGANRTNWTAGQLLEKWKRILRQIDVINESLNRLSNMTKEYEGSVMLTQQYYLANEGESLYRNSIDEMINSQSVLTNIAFPRTNQNRPVAHIFYEKYSRYDLDFEEERYESEFIELLGYEEIRDKFLIELQKCERYQLDEMITSVIKCHLRS